jgi:hypothetical protein
MAFCTYGAGAVLIQVMHHHVHAPLASAAAAWRRQGGETHMEADAAQAHNFNQWLPCHRNTDRLQAAAVSDNQVA